MTDLIRLLEMESGMSENRAGREIKVTWIDPPQFDEMREAGQSQQEGLEEIIIP
jgi:hypothetical protein